MNKKGMTIVELIVSFALTVVIALFLTEIVLFLRNSYVNNGIKTEIVNKQTLISDRIYSLLGSKRIIEAKDCEGNCVELTFDDGTYSQIAFNNNKAVIGDYVIELPSSCIVGNITAGTESFDNDKNYNSIFQIYVPITSSLIKDKSFDINLIYQYNNNQEIWSYNNGRSNYHMIIPNVETVLKNSEFNLLDGISLVDNDNNTIDVEIRYKSSPEFDINKVGEYKIDYYTFYDGKTYISSKIIYVVSFEYSYTVGAQEFIAYNDGYYKLEVWGAQGGPDSVTGGYGGYSKGRVYLTTGEILYIYVGQQPSTEIGGYNGGGNGSYAYSRLGYGGGGATHIALKDGLLSSLSDEISSILIVAGGGGGGTVWQNRSGGNGGGYIGNAVTTWGGATISGGNSSSCSFGVGLNANVPSVTDCGAEGRGGGGGGLCGGGAQQLSGANSNSTGAGGSGYIANNLLTDKYMYCHNCTISNDEGTKTNTTINVSETPTKDYAKIGNGFAKITYLGES